MARVQRDQKVSLCHFIWMGNHCHIIIVARDSYQCTCFYGEIKKQLTEAVKRLLGKEHLSLWQKNGTSVVLYGDLEAVVERVAYLYANPARAGLVDNIGHYPGVSSWSFFNSSEGDLQAESAKQCPWIRYPAIEKLPRKSLTPKQDHFVNTKLLNTASKKYNLLLEPNIWMHTFEIQTADEVKEVNQRIRERLDEFEAEARDIRSLKGWKVKGALALRKAGLCLKYISKTKTSRIFIYAIDSKLRSSMIQSYREFCEICDRCFRSWRLGDYTIEWPPGAFLPAMPPRQNYFA